MTERVVLIYKAEQANIVAEYVHTHPQTVVVALDFWALEELRERGIEALPITAYRGGVVERDVLLSQSRSIAREWYRTPAMTFFEHASISLGVALEPAVDVCAQMLLHYAYLIRAALDAHPGILVIPQENRRITQNAGPCAFFEFTAPVHAAQHVARSLGREIEIIGEAATHDTAMPVSRRKLLIWAWNFCMRLFPRKSLRIFASGSWQHIEPVLAHMDDAELMLMDRSEAKRISWRDRFRLRLQLAHADDLADAAIYSSAQKVAAQFETAWNEARKSVESLPALREGVIDMTDGMMPLFDHLVRTYAERIIRDIETYHALFQRHQISVVLLRASMSRHQPHFYCLARVAESLGIPSIELQHAFEGCDAASSEARLEATYLAGYGPLTRKIYADRGTPPERVVLTGSPRFDGSMTHAVLEHTQRTRHLTRLGLSSDRPVILFGVPAEEMSLDPGLFTSFEMRDAFDFFKRLSEAQPELQFIFKARPSRLYWNDRYDRYVRERLGKNVAIVQWKPVEDMLALSDILISPRSTVLFEANKLGVPAILYPFHEGDRVYLRWHEEGIVLATSDADAINAVQRLLIPSERVKQVERGYQHVRESYTFNGNASRAVARLIRETART